MNVCLLCYSFRFSKIELKKTPYQIIKWINHIYDCNTQIVYDNSLPLFYEGDNQNIDFDSFEGTDFIKIDERKKFNGYLNFIKENANKIDALIFFHDNLGGRKVISEYKRINRNGIVINILDGATGQSRNNDIKFKVKHIIKKILFKKYIDLIDAFTIETEKDFNYLIKNGFYGKSIANRLFLQTNGVLQDFLEDTSINKKKEKIILTVGRIGTYQKHNEMLFEALEKIDLKDWKVLLIGPITKAFNIYLESFFKRNEDKKDKIIFLGPIDDTGKLIEKYRLSSVFVITSRSESFCYALVEAAVSGNYIFSTEVGVAKELERNGILSIINSSEDLVQGLTKIINSNEIRINNEQINNISNKYNWELIIKNSPVFSKYLKK